MITKVKLTNFKSHKVSEIELSNLTVLCGSNGVGKSSFIQILLLLREAFLKDKSFDILDLKANSAKIGTANDAIYEFGDFDGFKVGLNFFENNYLNFHYQVNSENDREKSFIKLWEGTSKTEDNNQEIGNYSLFNRNFQYVSAARRGPMEKYDKEDKIVDVHRQISVMEGQAEYFVHFLDRYGAEDVLTELCIDGGKEILQKDLYSQVIFWEKYIFNGVNAEVQDIGKLGYTLKYFFDTEKNDTRRTASFDAKNVGFGLTYTMPLIVAILSASKDSLIIIENPEAHLHPSGISKLIELICIASQAGIQIILETHSDHIINGILVQSKKYEDSKGKTGIDRSNVSIYQFERDKEDNCCKAEKIKVEEGGRIHSTPNGFFDQIQNDLEQILGF